MEIHNQYEEDIIGKITYQGSSGLHPYSVLASETYKTVIEPETIIQNISF